MNKTGPTFEKAFSDKATFLAQNDLFRHLPLIRRMELERVVTLLTCTPGRILYRPGEAGSGLFFVSSGRIQLYHLSADGRKLITATRVAGNCFGELPFLQPDLHHSFAEAVEETMLYLIPRHEIEQILTQHSTVMLAFLQLLGQHFLQLESQLIDAAFKSTSARLASLLLELARPAAKTPLHLEVAGLSHEELAEHLGVYRETVSTALRDLKELGAITLSRKKITLIAPERLAELAAVEYKDAHTIDHTL